MRRILTLAVTALAALINIEAAQTIKAPKGGKAISDELLGIFFEDISYAADGGIYAELVQNGSFEYNPTERDGWGPGTSWRFVRPGHSLGRMEPRMDNPLHPNNPTYMRLYIERVGHYSDYDGWTGVGIENNGFDGISVKAGQKYDFSVFLRNVEGDNKEVRVVLVEPGRPAKLLADQTIVASLNTWQQIPTTLTPSESSSRAVLQLLVLGKGAIDVDEVSLTPQDTYNGHGLRKDLIQALADLKPKFMRFPGGCVVHGGGDGFWDTYRWKTTLGPRHERKHLKNTWGYHQSMGLGYYEYFQLCEDLNMEPVPILPCGVSCQGTNGGWGMPGQAQDVAPMSEMDEWTQDALDLIEWANGDVNTKWGKIRAEQGHPKPFGLKYLGLGNEERISPEFCERFKYMYERVTKAHPEIVIVGTVGPGSHPGNSDYENGWKLSDELGIPLADEHYYEPNHYFLTSKQYDKYPRDRKTKVYLGEYAAKDKKLIDALAEALYLLHVERNGDIVCMTSYAPLFARKGATNWNPDLIYFDNERAYPTCSYYVQQMFGQSSGQYYYGDCVKLEPNVRDNADGIDQSVVLNVKTRQLFVKICNTTSRVITADVNLSRFREMKKVATKTTLSGQPEQENNYETQPIAPKTETIKAERKKTYQLAPYSFTMFTYQL